MKQKVEFNIEKFIALLKSLSNYLFFGYFWEFARSICLMGYFPTNFLVIISSSLFIQLK